MDINYRAELMRLGGSDRSSKVLQTRANSFLQLAGDPAKGFTNGKMCHALRSRFSTTVVMRGKETDVASYGIKHM